MDGDASDRDRLSTLQHRLPAMVETLASFVTAESPSSDVEACLRCADVVAAAGRDLLGVAPERHLVDGRTHLLWRFSPDVDVLLIGHLDTVWPLGTTADWPFSYQDGVVTGPGSFDMKAGLVQGLHALATLDDLSGVAFLVTADEEIGSSTSRALIESTAASARAVLVLEPAVGAAVKTARKGTSFYEVAIVGRAAHAGLEPERGVNALLELAHQVLAVSALADPLVGTTVTPAVAEAGTVVNVVPAAARLQVDARATSVAEQERVDAGMRALVPVVPEATLAVRGGPNRPPLEPAASEGLFEVAARVAELLGLPPLEGRAVGGGSDGNFTAALGVATLDGLGPVGDGAHARGEHVVVASMPERAALVAALVDALRAGQ